MKKIIKENVGELSELGPKMAAVAMNKNAMRNDARSKTILSDAITSLFSKYIGKDLDFYIKTNSNQKQPAKYKLIEVKFNYTGAERHGVYGPGITFYFYNENGVDGEEPFIENKKEVELKYDIKNDDYRNRANGYAYNPLMVSFLIKAANISRAAYAHYDKPKKVDPESPLYNQTYIPDEEKFNDMKVSKLTKAHFNMFPFDKNNLLNINENKAMDLKKFINEEISKLHKRTLLEDKKTYIQKELKLLKEGLDHVAYKGKLNLREILHSYLETALWAEGDEGEFDGKSFLDISNESVDSANQDIINFLNTAKSNPESLEELKTYDEEQIGHNLWLSRNGHGAGFFDDWNDKLQEIAKGMGHKDIYIGDNGVVYIN